MSTLRVNNMTNVGGTGPTYAPGHVIKTYFVQMDTTQTFTGGSSVIADLTGLTLTVTPTSSASKLLVTSTIYMGNNSAGGATTNKVMINKGGSVVAESALRFSTSNDSSSLGSYAVTYLDSPASTSPITYKIQAAQWETGSTLSMYINRNGAASTLMAKSFLQIQEIAA